MWRWFRTDRHPHGTCFRQDQLATGERDTILPSSSWMVGGRDPLSNTRKQHARVIHKTPRMAIGRESEADAFFGRPHLRIQPYRVYRGMGADHSKPENGQSHQQSRKGYKLSTYLVDEHTKSPYVTRECFTSFFLHNFRTFPSDGTFAFKANGGSFGGRPGEPEVAQKAFQVFRHKYIASLDVTVDYCLSVEKA